MKIIILIIILMFTFIYSQNDKKDEIYIIKHIKIAIEEMYKYKIPASIKISQALLESANGESDLAKNANNHFGIKCKNVWEGEIYLYTDDNYIECFRKYSSVKESYRDHSLFLINGKNYLSLFSIPINNYKEWAFQLKKSGYASNPEYPEIIISKIEKYKLYEFDKIKIKNLNKKIKELFPNTINFFN